MPVSRPPLSGLPPLLLLRAFEAAARAASFTAAAKELNITQAAVSYQVRALEDHLGFALFERKPRGVKLTAMGVAYLAPVRKAFDDLAISTVGLFGSRTRVQIRVQAPVSFAALWLAPRLPGFLAAYPDIEVRLSSTVWENAVPDAATDLEIRYGDGRFPGYSSERLMNQSLAIACSPAVRALTSDPVDLTALAQSQMIHIMGHEPHWLLALSALRVGDVDAIAGPTVDTTVAALEMAASGAGYVLTHPLFMAPYLQSGRLVLSSGQTFADPQSFYVVAPDRPQRTRREVHVFQEWLKHQADA
jgi:LysR family transcriptional regulator, glycine cleavage system transcriptional activator